MSFDAADVRYAKSGDAHIERARALGRDPRSRPSRRCGTRPGDRARPVPADAAHKGYAMLSARPIIRCLRPRTTSSSGGGKEKEQEEKKERNRRTTVSVKLLDDSGRVKAGDPIKLNLSHFTPKERPKIDALLAEHPDAAEAEWTSRGSREPPLAERRIVIRAG